MIDPVVEQLREWPGPECEDPLGVKWSTDRLHRINQSSTFGAHSPRTRGTALIRKSSDNLS